MSKEKTAVFDYLEKVNRPYSANDILQNLHKEYTKTAIQKALDQLVSEQKIREKTYNKQKIYSINQQSDENVNCTQEELERLNAQILEQTEAFKQLERELKLSESSLNEIQSTLTTKDTQIKVNELKSKLIKMEEKLACLSANQELISEDEKQKIKKQYDAVVKEYKKRKRICMDIISGIMEGYPKTKAALMEEIGIELDNESNIPSI